MIARFCIAALLASSPIAAQTAVRDLSPLCRRTLGQGHLPALVVGVWRDGQMRGLGVAGVRAAGSKVPVERGDLWHLGSCTKAMTATLCGIAVERGLFRFEDNLGEFFAQRGFAVHDDIAPIRIEQLLDHSSGLISHHAGLWARYYRDERPQRTVRREIAQVLLAAAPETPPGSRYNYSNFGYLLAGVVLEEAFDLDWEGLMRRELFDPLGMRSAGFGPPGEASSTSESDDRNEDPQPDQPRGHRWDKDRFVPVAPGREADNPPWFGPAGTVHMSASDWGKFLGLHLGANERVDGSPEPLLSPATLERLHRSTSGFDYALGWATSPRAFDGEPALLHTGSNTMWFATCALSPTHELALFVITNAAGQAAEETCAALVKELGREELKRLK